MFGTTDTPRQVLPPPEALVKNGRFTFGTFSGAIRCINPLQAKNPLGSVDLDWLKFLRLKEWQAFQFGNEEVFCLAVVYNSKSVGLAQVVVVDKIRQKKWLYEKLVPFWETHVASGLFDTHSHYTSKDMSLRFHNDLDHQRITLELSIAGHKGGPDVRAHLTGQHNDHTAPIVICQPFGPNRALYSHKNLMPLQGSLTQGKTEHRFEADDSFMIMDDHKGYYPYKMRYDWVTGAGRDAGGGLLGFNLTDNQILEPEKYNENCLWAAGAMHPLPPVKVHRPGGVDAPWQVTDEHGRVDVTFTPLYPGVVKLNLLVMESDYYGPYGEISGSIKDSAGKKHKLDGLFGMGEKKYVRA